MPIPKLELLTLELTAACNYSCVMCRSYKRRKKAGDPFKADRPEMSLNKFKSLVDQATELNSNVMINPQKSGESLLYHDILLAMSYVKEKGARLQFTTNGSLLNKEVRQKILDIEADQIIISIDGFTKKTFEKIRGSEWRDPDGRSPYEATVQNTLALIEERDQAGLTKPYVSVAFCVQHQNWHELDAFKSFWGPKADSIGIFNVIQLTSYQKLFYEGMLEDRKPCGSLWRELNISSDGTVVNCSGDGKARNPVGNIHDQSLKDVWYGKMMEQMREDHTNGRFDKYVTCKDCNLWSPSPQVRRGFELMPTTTNEYFLERYVQSGFESYQRRKIEDLPLVTQNMLSSNSTDNSENFQKTKASSLAARIAGFINK